MNTKTPLTDAAELKCRDVNGGVYGMVDADDMAKLERKCTSLQSALDEAEKDAERLAEALREYVPDSVTRDALSAHEARVNPKGAK